MTFEHSKTSHWRRWVANSVDAGGLSSMLELLTNPTSAEIAYIKGFHEAGDGGSGVFYWDATANKNTHNGGTIIDPDNAADLATWDASAKTTWFTAGSGFGCWIRLFNGPIAVNWFGAQVGTDDSHDSFENAFIVAGDFSNSTGSVYVPPGHWTIDTDGGSIDIPEGVEFYGSGGVQINRPSVDKQGTVINITGTTNEAFTYNRGCYIHNLSFDYPDQDEDAVTPTTYPELFEGDASTTGARSFFQNIIIDKCWDGFLIGGGTQFDNVHGCFYRRFIKIQSSAAFIHITACSTSALWHNTTNTNTTAYQQDNLTIVEINGGADGLKIEGCTFFVAKTGFSLVSSDAVNFFSCDNTLFDGVMDPVVNDGTVQVKSMQFSNCFFGLLNSYGSTFRISPMIFNAASPVSYLDHVVSFSNCRFRNPQGGVFTVESGVDQLILDGCSFYDWDQDQAAGAQSNSVVYMNDSDANLIMTGCIANNTDQYDAAIETRLVTVNAANRVTIASGDFKKINKLVNVVAAKTLPRLTITSITADDVDNLVALGAGAAITSKVISGNNLDEVQDAVFTNDVQIDGDAQIDGILTLEGNFTQNGDGSPTAQSTTVLGQAKSTGNVGVEMGLGRTGDGAAFIDFHSSTGVSYNTRFIRNSGVNGTTQLSHDGTGNLLISTQDAADLVLRTSATTALTLAKTTQKGTFAGDVQIDGDAEVGGTLFVAPESTEGMKVGDISTGTYGWNDITSEIKARGQGATDPTWSVINGTAFSAYEFSIGDKCWMSFHLPHDYAKGTDLYLHAHWLPDGTNTNSVKWEFTYAYAHGHNQAAFSLGSPTVITAEQTVGGTQYQHYVTETAAFTITNCEPDGILEVAVERITNGGTDNTDNIFLLTADVHYQSTGVPTLNRAPNFYGA